MQRNIDDLFLKLMQQVTTSHLHRLLVVLDQHVLYTKRARFVCKMSAMVANCGINPLIWFCGSL